MTFFFYGSLREATVRRRVLGRDLPPSRLRPAVLEGFRRVFPAQSPYPTLVPAVGGKVPGLLAGGLDHRAARRLQAYEGPGYVRIPLLARTDDRLARAFVFVARPDPTGT